MDEVDGMEEVEFPLVEGVLEGAFGALGDEHWGCGVVFICKINEELFGWYNDKFLFLGIVWMGGSWWWHDDGWWMMRVMKFELNMHGDYIMGKHV
jgi:hypothetical protein